MTVLHVIFPKNLNWPGWNVSEFTLSSNALHPRDLTVIVNSEIHADYYSDSPIFRATLDDPSATPVALKFAFREDLIPDLAQEAAVYDTDLHPLQGTAVPHSYGLFNGTSDTGPIACLLLEYWGQCLSQPFHALPISLRICILQKLSQIHRHGVWHGDFAERNVLECNGDVRIIDFDQTQKHHCHCHIDFRPGDALPDEKDFGCPQLWEVSYFEMKIWHKDN